MVFLTLKAFEDNHIYAIKHDFYCLINFLVNTTSLHEFKKVTTYCLLITANVYRMEI